MTQGYYTAEDCNLDDFTALIRQSVDPASVPRAAEIIRNVPIYDVPTLRDDLNDTAKRQGIMAEWAQTFLSGAGVIVLRNAYADTTAIDHASDVFTQIIANEKAAGASGADHFAAGTNDRIWNSLEKLCLAAPETHMRYFANPAIDAACEAWLGPNYQMSAQVNLVYPGGAAQQAHRDYHLGFQTADVSATYPAHVHHLSPLMTLQGGIAHADTPIDSGPTKLLPFSQMYKPGYAAWRRDDFRACFEENFVQVPLAKGDALFFNPALFHAAGANTTPDIHRLVNLLQISSAFGCPMETINRVAMCHAVYDPLQAAWQAGQLDDAALHASIASTAAGYSFPTNLDTDPPVGGLAPKTQAALMAECIRNGTSKDDFVAALATQEARRANF